MDRRLKQFLAVAETGNVSSAADAMHVSQPTVSVNMKRLEEEYGVPLFTRSSRGVVLTRFGKVLYEHVRVMSRLNDHATAELRAMKAINRPSLKVGCGLTWWHLFVQKSLREITNGNADVAIHVDICSSYDGLRNLLSGDVTCFIGTKVPDLNDPTTFDFNKLFGVEDAFFARRGHPLQGRQVCLKDMNEYPELDVTPFANQHLGIIGLNKADISEKISNRIPAQFSSNAMTSGISMLQDSNAYLVYPISTKDFFETQDIQMLQVSDRSREKCEIGIYTLAERQETALQQNFLDIVKSTIALEPVITSTIL